MTEFRDVAENAGRRGICVLWIFPRPLMSRKSRHLELGFYRRFRDLRGIPQIPPPQNFSAPSSNQKPVRTSVTKHEFSLCRLILTRGKFFCGFSGSLITNFRGRWSQIRHITNPAFTGFRGRWSRIRHYHESGIIGRTRIYIEQNLQITPQFGISSFRVYKF